MCTGYSQPPVTRQSAFVTAGGPKNSDQIPLCMSRVIQRLTGETTPWANDVSSYENHLMGNVLCTCIKLFLLLLKYTILHIMLTSWLNAGSLFMYQRLVAYKSSRMPFYIAGITIAHPKRKFSSNQVRELARGCCFWLKWGGGAVQRGGYHSHRIRWPFWSDGMLRGCLGRTSNARKGPS